MRERPASRLLILDQNNCVLLFHFVFDDGPLAGKRFWATPGGALKKGENFFEAAQRELCEETGIIAQIGPQVMQKTVTFQTPAGVEVEADERYFLVHVADRRLDESGQEPAEVRYIKGHRWWSIGELAVTKEQVYPEGLADLIATQI
ncbi:MAG: NUDIX hydrolase [Geminicoccaceae bacterium]